MIGELFFFDRGFVDQHYRDVGADRVDAMAGGALEALLVGRELDRSLARRADKNFEKFLRDGHDGSSRYESNVAKVGREWLVVTMWLVVTAAADSL